MGNRAITPWLIGGASCLAMAPGAAWAQQGDTETIVVTAQKREQALEDVPVSIAVVDNEFIDRSDLRDLSDYLDLVPGVTGETGGASGDGISVRIRGIGALGGNTNTFGVYVDGFDTTGASTALAGSRLVDAERVEVLRGPQGTSFGRNVVAGAISITSLTPRTDDYSARIAIDGGNNGTFGAQGRVNVPLSDTTAALFSGFFDRTSGYVDNLTPTGSPEDTQKNFGLRGSIQTDPNDRLSIKASLSFERLTQELQSQVPDGTPNPFVQSFIDIINLGLNPFLPPSVTPSPLDTFFPEQGAFGETNTAESNERENTIATVNASYDFGETSLVWVSGYSYSEAKFISDADFSSLDNVIAEGGNAATFMSTEVRFQNNGDERFDYIGGVFISHGRFNGFSSSVAGETLRLSTFLPPIPQILGPLAPLFPEGLIAVDTPPGTPVVQSDINSTTFGVAVFADLDVQVTDRWNVLFGGRYNYDEESQSVTDLVDINPDPNFPVPDLVFLATPFADNEGDVQFDAFTWRASTVYDLTETINVYATVSTGYRPGGLQLANVTPTETEQLDFEPEQIINYEIGLKTTFFDGRLLINASGYMMNWTDIQLSIADPITGVPFAGNGEAEAAGFEVDFIASPIDGLTVQGGVAFLDSEVTSLEGGISQQAIVGEPLPYAPRWQGTLTATYQRRLFEDIDGFIRATFAYVGDRGERLAAAQEQFILESYHRLDLRFGISRQEDWRIEGFVTNATNEIYATGAFTNGFAVRGNILRVAPPRQYSVRLVAEF
ncbi:MAG: TonB-dependent receptor [Alphaproteobacteria bacterium]